MGPDGHTVAAAGNQFNAKTWETASGRELVRLPHSDTVQALAFSPDGRTIATAGNESAAHLWDAASGREVGRIAIESASDAYALAFSPDSRQLAVVSDDNRVSTWEATKPWQVTGLQHDGLVNNATFSPDGRYLATVVLMARFASGTRPLANCAAAGIRVARPIPYASPPTASIWRQGAMTATPT